MFTLSVRWGDGRDVSEGAIETLCDGDAEPKIIEMREFAVIRVVGR